MTKYEECDKICKITKNKCSFKCQMEKGCHYITEEEDDSEEKTLGEIKCRKQKN